MRTILLTRGTGGDLLPFIRIGKALKARGHTAILMTHADYAEKVKSAGLEHAAIGYAGEFDELLGQTASFSTQDFVAGLKQGLPSLLNGYERHRHLFDGENVLLVAHHNTHLGAQFISEKHGIPAISIFTAPHFVLNMPFWEQAYTLVSDELNGIRAAMGLPAVHDWCAWWRTLQYFVGLWPGWYASPDASWPVEVEAVGFILDESAGQVLPVEIEPILDNPTPTLLITHATSSTTRSQFFDLSMAACQAMGWQAILVTPHRSLLPDILPPGMYYYPALPFNCLLPRVKAVIHHGGIGTLAHTMAAGVPQLILGIGFDRPDNGTRAQALGVAEFIPLMQWRVETICNALRHLVSSPLVKQRCEVLSGQVLADDALEKACRYLERVVTESPVGVSQPQAPALNALAGDPKRPSSTSVDVLNNLSIEKRALLAMKLRQKKSIT